MGLQYKYEISKFKLSSTKTTGMSFALLFLCSCFGAMGVIWVIHLYHSSTRLSDIPGPPVPSYIVGNVQELERAPMGTKMNTWTKKYGQTYKIRGALMVRFSAILKSYEVNGTFECY